MNSQEFVLSLMDLLDLDEEIIDQRLKSIMENNKYTSKHLTSAIYLLQYKQLVNLQDQCDCTNDDECDFVAKLIRDIDEENVNHVCEIVSITLGLNAETLINKSEHFLQQILSDIDVPANKGDGSETPEQSTMLLYFKISDRILDTVIKKGEKLTLPFLELPVKSILHSSDEKLKIHFLTTSVPKFFLGISGFNILDKIWEHVKELKDDNLELTLKVLSLLSDYYLPVADSKGNVLFKSEIVKQFEFWNNILNGLLSTDPSIRKISIYLLKRAIDCVMVLNKNICVKSHNRTIFIWYHENKKNLKLLWDNFFILLDSLEEKQSNIVLPSLQLFASLKSLEDWLISAYNIGLKHDNTQVRLKCIQQRLMTRIKSQSEASVLLEALNDINLYDNIIECEDLKRKMSTFISDKEVFVHIFTVIPFIKWSPVPFYHITSILSEINFQDCVSKVTNIPISQSIIDVLKVPCNNIVIRKAVFNNIAHFVRNCCNGLNWKDLLNVYCMLQTEVCLNNLFDPLISPIHKDFPVGTGKEDFFKVILQSHLHIDFGLLYLQNHPEDVLLFIELVLDKINTVQDMVNRQYSDKLACFSDVIYLTQLHYKINESSSSVSDSVRVIVAGAFRTIINYIHSLLFNNSILSVDEISILSIGFHSMSVLVNEPEIKDIISQLYKTSMLFITDKDTVLETKVLSLYVIHCLHTNKTLVANYKQEMFSLKEIITLTEKFENKQSIGRLRNIFYEKVCEIAYQLLKDEESSKDIYLKEIVKFIDNVIECGGYGCLRFCLNIMNFILPSLLENESLKYDVTQFINRIWNEIEELKSNNQYNPCIEEFVNLITQDCLLKRPAYNNVITLYCNKIIENGALRNAPLFYLVRNINHKIITANNGQIVYLLREILLYSPVPRKDQRIVENLVVDILQEAKDSSSKQQIGGHYNFQIQSITVLILTKIKEKDILINLEFLIKKRIEEVFKNKQRYHGHSQAHRLLLIAVQHLLLILALKNGDSEETLNWCVQLLRKLPHQPSVRICLEWYIALYFYIKNAILAEKFFEKLKSLPATSQFMILFWIVKHKTLEDTITEEEYEFVMDVLLSHTMGQMFNIRLHAQYLATKLHEIRKTNSSKYSYTINVIEKTFVESAKDKNFVKLQQDYMVNNFDIVNDLTPSFIYYFLPRYCEVNNNESVDLIYVREIMENINSNILSHDFFERSAFIKRSDEDIFTSNIWDDTRSKIVDDTEIVGTLQKKYVPWKNMTEVNLYDASKKRESSSALVVVASLIDKLPNLGGMARTSEVFGVKTYVVDSLRHLQDKQFQGLSVSAERWIDMEEVRPGQPLKQYLIQKKIEGYSIVAAEQTSTSAKLQSFKFPKKTLLLLGHEKEGIPCDLLPMMDFCVEIPQKGFIRSLNVHVTAAIFIWEYARQNIL